MTKLEYMDAPRENLETWRGVTKLLFISAGAIAVLLLLLAWAFT